MLPKKFRLKMKNYLQNPLKNLLNDINGFPS